MTTDERTWTMETAHAAGTGTAESREDASEIREKGIRLLELGRLEDAQRLFERLARMPGQAAEGLYLQGVARGRGGDLANARRLFEAAVELTHDHAGAWYQLGWIAERSGRLDDAATYYGRALAANPSLSRAAVSLRKLAQGSTPAGTSTDGAGQTENGHAPSAASLGRLGIYHFLASDPSPLSQEAVRLMDAVRLTRRARGSAYVGRHFASVVAGSLLAGGLLAVAVAAGGAKTVKVHRHHHHHLEQIVPVGMAVTVGIIAAILFMIVGFLAVVLYAKSVTIRIENARLQVRRGVFRKTVSNIELWRVQNIELERSLVNRITGDGSLSIHLNVRDINPSLTRRQRRRQQPDEPILVTGIARRPELDELYEHLLDLAFALRTNNMIKGIFQ